VNNRSALFVQAARGPILLIAVGVLFALQQSGQLPFSHTWPLLIIIIGVLKLIERMVLPQASAPPMPPVSQSGGPAR